MSRIVTYSPAHTIVPTYECFNQCSYCNFRTDPGKSDWLSLGTAKEQLLQLQSQGICEILILSGEVHPNSSRRQEESLERRADLRRLHRRFAKGAVENMRQPDDGVTDKARNNCAQRIVEAGSRRLYGGGVVIMFDDQFIMGV